MLIASKPGRWLLNTRFKSKYISSAGYWENRYKKNGTSGVGSYGRLAIYKSTYLNRFVADNKIVKVLELGCGDGNQLQQFDFREYIGLDVSPMAIEKCRKLFPNNRSRKFFIYDDQVFAKQRQLLTAELVISLDVLYHLLEDDVFEKYVRRMFAASSRFVIIYSWNEERAKSLHMRYRKFTSWIEKNITGWHLKEIIKNEVPNLEACDFYIYTKNYSL